MTTVKNMFGGVTKDPRHSTFAKIAGAMRYKYTLEREDEDKPNYDREIPKAHQQRRDYQSYLAKRRERQNPKA